MPFTKKFPKSGDTTHTRIPIVYAELVEELLLSLDANYEVEKGQHLLRKFIHNLT
jgi:hypothetical protein